MFSTIITRISRFFSKKNAPTVQPSALNPNYDSTAFYIIGRDRELSRHTETILRRIVAETGKNTKIHIQY